MEPGLGSCTCVTWDSVYRSSKERKKNSEGFVFFFPSLRCFSPLLYGALVLCVLFKVCKRCCLERKKFTAAIYAFPCDATRVHRGALSLDTNAEISCPHPLPSLTTSCNVIYKPSSSRVGILFFFIHHSLTRVVQRTKGLLVYHFAVECFFFF